MMKFSISADWQNGLLDAIDVDSVDELYGCLDQDSVGMGCFSFSPSGFSKPQFTAYLEKVRQKGLKFNYLLNTVCVGNRELTIKGQKRLRKLLDWLLENNVYAVTVSIPYLLKFIKYNYPDLKVYVSMMGGVDSFERAEYWESLGADRIALSAISGIARNFTLLKKIRENIKCQLELIANLSCLNECPFWTYHAAVLSHFSQSFYPRQKCAIDYCSIKCNYMKMKDPAEFIRFGWIRPEDLRYYEKLGIERIKFANQDMNTEDVIKILKAYSDKHYEGNLLDLFSGESKNRSCVYIDNRKLDGFLEYFIKEDCGLKSCQACNYCSTISEKVIKIDDIKRSDLIGTYEKELNEIISAF